VYLSSIFKWYGDDFGEDKTAVLRWLLKYLDEDKQKKLERLLKRQTKVKYVNFICEIQTKKNMIPRDADADG
jgi:hypothetical protein